MISFLFLQAQSGPQGRRQGWKAAVQGRGEDAGTADLDGASGGGEKQD